MRKSLILFVVMFIVSIFVFGQEAQKPAKFFIQLNGSFLFPADGDYKEVYGSLVFYPGIKAGYNISKNFYLWLGYDYVNKSGTTPELDEEAKSTQHFIGLGAGYQRDFSEKFGYRVQAGILYISYKEEALGETVSGSAIGFELEGNLVYNFSNRVYGLFVLGYAYGSDDYEDESFKLGGLKTGIGLGIRF